LRIDSGQGLYGKAPVFSSSDQENIVNDPAAVTIHPTKPPDAVLGLSVSAGEIGRPWHFLDKKKKLWIWRAVDWPSQTFFGHLPPHFSRSNLPFPYAKHVKSNNHRYLVQNQPSVGPAPFFELGVLVHALDLFVPKSIRGTQHHRPCIVVIVEAMPVVGKERHAPAVMLAEHVGC